MGMETVPFSSAGDHAGHGLFNKLEEVFAHFDEVGLIEVKHVPCLIPLDGNLVPVWAGEFHVGNAVEDAAGGGGEISVATLHEDSELWVVAHGAAEARSHVDKGIFASPVPWADMGNDFVGALFDPF